MQIFSSILKTCRKRRQKWRHLELIVPLKFPCSRKSVNKCHVILCITDIRLRYTGCFRGNLQSFGRTFLMLVYINTTEHTCIWIWTVREVMTREKCRLLGVLPSHVHNNRSVAHLWNQMDPARTLHSRLIGIRFNFITHSTPESSKRFLCFRFSHQKTECIFLISHLSHIYLFSHPFLFGHLIISDEEYKRWSLPL